MTPNGLLRLSRSVCQLDGVALAISLILLVRLFKPEVFKGLKS